MTFARALLGIAILLGLAWLLSRDRQRIPWRIVVGGILLQIVVVFAVSRTGAGRAFFEGASAFISKLVSMTVPGAEMVFGGLARPNDTLGFVFAFAGTGLVVIIFVSALMSVLYHLRVMQVLVWALAKVMSRTMGLSGGESMAAAANIFMGQTEAPLVVKPYLAGMTKSELNALMTGGFATIAGSVMAVYMQVIGPEIAPHLVTASVMSAPASFVIAKIVLPEREVSATSGRVELRFDRSARNVIEAAANGTSDGLRLWLNVIAMLIAFVALVALVNWPLEALGEALALDGGLSIQRIFGWIFAPIAWTIGIGNWHDCQIVGGLLGTQVSINEFVAFQGLAQTLQAADPAQAFQDPRSAKIAAYALCGFANFSSIGIQMGGLSALVPERKAELSDLALRAMLGGALACWTTATVAGAFL
ncbi:MAG: NupC/NupG family nucleoside CNT transporter [Planctomycetes bacterium]|nr:NupC/NupG family nucleoside CNT transporter [Planctomycetota bacterium]